MYHNLMSTTPYQVLLLRAPDDGTGTGEPSQDLQDGTVAGAALALAELTLEDEVDDDGAADDGNQNDDAGQADGQDDGANDDAPKSKADDDATGDKAKAGDDDGAEDEEWFELPPETEGGEPVRVAATAVWEGYQKSEELAAENATLKERNDLIPEEVDKALRETVATRQQLVASLETWEQLTAPPPPNPEMLDQNSDKFDPTGYKEALDRSNAFAAAQGEAKNELAKQQKALQEETAIRHQAAIGRANAEIKQFWPEIVESKEARASFEKNMHDAFGATAEELQNTYDPRFFKMAKAALAFEASQKATKQAVKIVRGKPKLVKGKARDSNQKRTSRDNAMARLFKDGNDEASAVAALETFDD